MYNETWSVDMFMGIGKETMTAAAESSGLKSKNFLSNMSTYIFIAAILLIFPGFATDILGLLLVIPFSRKIIFKLLSKKFQSNKKDFKQKDFIEGEYKDIDER